MNNLSTIIRFMNRSGTYFLKCPSPVAMLCNRSFSTTSNPVQLKLEKETFQDVWPNLVRTIVQDQKIARLPELATWIQKVLDYNTTGGKMLRGLATVFSYECVEKPERITAESLELARIMGWCVEILQGYFVMLDDIMDGATTRRGQLCWHNRPEVGQGLAINDSIFLHMSLLIALKKYFSDHPSYSQMTQLFNDVLLSTAMGQHLDIVTAKKNYSTYTMEHLNAIAKYKTAYYTFQLPVSLGLLLANITDEEVHSQVEDICIHLGKLFQMQDDYLDCFGEESVTGKVGTDIQEGKCTWFAVQALSSCNERQKLIFTTCYGSDNPENVEAIRSLYKELGLIELFDDSAKRTSDLIVKKSEILQESTGVPAHLTTTLLDMLRKRKH